MQDINQRVEHTNILNKYINKIVPQIMDILNNNIKLKVDYTLTKKCIDLINNIITDVDKLVNIPGSVLDIKDYGALFINGELQYTPEVILKARLLKLQPSELVKRQGEALLKSNNPDHKLIADRIGLKEKLKNIPTSEMDLLKKIQDLGDKELLFIFNRGLDKASPKQIERLLARLEEQVDAPRNTFIMNQGFQENEETKDREGNK